MRRLLCVLTACTVAMAASAAAASARQVVSGAVLDPRGDASVSPFTGPPAADIRRFAVRYDDRRDTFEVRVTLWGPVPALFSLKTVFVSETCPITPFNHVLDYDLGGTAALRINGMLPLEVTRTTERHGRHLIETWTGPELDGLALGCATGSVSTGGIGGFGLDEVDTFVLR